MTTLALDLSSTATGLCLDGQTATVKPKGDLLARCQATRAAVTANTPHTVNLIVYEAIGTRHVQTAIAIASVHALVLDEISGWDVDTLEVAPAKLKKWATGKGNADKTAMVTSAMRSGWDAPDNATDDQADAWHLWTLGEATRGRWHVAETAYRTEVLEVVQ